MRTLTIPCCHRCRRCHVGPTPACLSRQRPCLSRAFESLPPSLLPCLQCLQCLQSEYPPECDARREFISGFDGSAGTVVVTADVAALWTDGRYFLQARGGCGTCAACCCRLLVFSSTYSSIPAPDLGCQSRCHAL